MNVDQVFTGCLLYQRLPEGAVFLQLPVYPSQKQPLQLDQQGSNPQFHPCILAVSQCNAKHKQHTRKLHDARRPATNIYVLMSKARRVLDKIQ